MQIGKTKLLTGAALAPMAGGTNAVMRSICASFGAVFTVSEMVSAKALTMQDKKSRSLLRGGGGGAPFGVQLFGNNAEIMAAAIKLIKDEEYDFIDINMGCPAPKIVQGGSGSALLKQPKLAEEIVAAAVKACAKPVSVKMRIGWDKSSINGEELAKRCEAAGAAFVAVHARTREEMYRPGTHPDVVAKIKNAVKIPVLYNGDINDGQSAKKMLEYTGCAGIMVGRAAAGRPWLFAEIAAVLGGGPVPGPPSLHRRLAIMQEEVQALCNTMGEQNGMRHARGVAANYMQGLKGAAKLRYMAVSLERYGDVAQLIEKAYALEKGL